MDIELRIPSPDYPPPKARHEARQPVSRPSILRVDCDDFVRELAAETGAHAQVIRAVVRAFLAAALRGPDARTPDGWRSVIQELRYVLGSALGAGVKARRPVGRHTPIKAAPAYESELPARLVHALVRTYVSERMSDDEGTTPEGRSRILSKTRELVWDGMLDAVKQVPCPLAQPVQGAAPAPRRIPPERER